MGKIAKKYGYFGNIIDKIFNKLTCEIPFPFLSTIT